MAKNKFFFALFFLLTFAFFSCDKNKVEEIQLDNSDPLALAPDIRWALVVDPYAAFRKETSWDAEPIGYCKKGELFPVLASASVPNEKGVETWYFMEDGWLPESVISIYQNKFKAAKAAALLEEKK